MLSLSEQQNLRRVDPQNQQLQKKIYCSLRETPQIRDNTETIHQKPGLPIANPPSSILGSTAPEE